MFDKLYSITLADVMNGAEAALRNKEYDHV